LDKRKRKWRIAMLGLLSLIGAATAHAQVPAVSLAATLATANELGPSPGSFTLSRSGSTAAALNVAISRSGTASNGSDYVFVSSSIVIPVAQSSVVLSIVPLRDNVVEGEETVVIGIAASPSYAIATPDPATVRILDDPAIVQLVASAPAANEQGLLAGAFTLSRSGGDTANSLSVPLSRLGTAGNGSDYGFVSSSVVFPANQMSVAVPITPIADNQVEGEETVVYSLIASTNFLPGASGGGTVTIADDPAIVTLSTSDGAADESGPDEGRMRLIRSGGDTAFSLNVPLIRAGSASNGVDYAFIPSSINFGAGVLEAFITVAPLRDNLVEGSEEVAISLSASNTFNPGASAAASVAIADDPAIVTLSVTDPGANELNLETGIFAMSRSGGDPSVSLPVALLRGGSAANGTDYDFVASSFVFPANSLTGTIAITPIADNLVEGTENVGIALPASTTFIPGASSSGSISITDDPPVVSIGATAPLAFECGTSGTITVARGGGDLASSLTLLLMRSGSASNGVDYSFIGASIVIPADASELDLSVVPIFDEIAEDDEIVQLTLLDSPASYVISPPAAASVTIENCVIDVFFDGFEPATVSRTTVSNE
jgi:hypothetical protein